MPPCNFSNKISLPKLPGRQLPAALAVPSSAQQGGPSKERRRPRAGRQRARAARPGAPGPGNRISQAAAGCLATRSLGAAVSISKETVHQRVSALSLSKMTLPAI